MLMPFQGVVPFNRSFTQGVLPFGQAQAEVPGLIASCPCGARTSRANYAQGVLPFGQAQAEVPGLIASCPCGAKNGGKLFT